MTCGNPAKFYSSIDSNAFYCSKDCFVGGKFDKDKEELDATPFVYRYALGALEMDYGLFKESLRNKEPREIAFNLATVFYYEDDERKSSLLAYFTRYLNYDAKFSMLLIRTPLIKYDYAEAYVWLHEKGTNGQGLNCFLEIQVCWREAAWTTLRYINTICTRSERELARLWVSKKIAANGLKPGYLEQVTNDKDLYWSVLTTILDGRALLADAELLINHLSVRLLDTRQMLAFSKKLLHFKDTRHLYPHHEAQLRRITVKLQHAMDTVVT